MRLNDTIKTHNSLLEKVNFIFTVRNYILGLISDLSEKCTCQVMPLLFSIDSSLRYHSIGGQLEITYLYHCLEESYVNFLFM